MDDTRARAPLELASSTALDRVDEGGGGRASVLRWRLEVDMADLRQQLDSCALPKEWQAPRASETTI